MRPAFLVFLLLSFLLILLDNLGILRPVRGGVEKLVVPLKEKIYSLKPRGDKTTERLEEKERKIAYLESQISVLRSENEAARRLLGTPLPPSWKFTPARVIGLPTNEYLQINKGEKEGIRKGMAVVFQNVFVGKVSWTGDYFSQVSLPGFRGGKIQVIARSPQPGIKAQGLLIGQGEKVFLERVLIGETVEEGDLVLTAGDEDLPPDLLLGRIKKVDKKLNEIYQRAEVELLVSLRKLENVFVVVAR